MFEQKTIPFLKWTGANSLVNLEQKGILLTIKDWLLATVCRHKNKTVR
jgi:hypothetical protein